MPIINFIQNQTGLKEKAIVATIHLFENKATIPFIARYRKEMTDGLDEVQIASIKTASEKFEQINARQETILKAIEEQGKLTEQLTKRIKSCFVMNELEDIYLPYKKKRKTRAETARQKGLENLAKIIMSQGNQTPQTIALRFLNKGVKNIDEALAGARDIIAEWVSENEIVRSRLRNSYANYSKLIAKVVPGKEKEAENYSDYFDYSAKLSNCPSHRFLAIYRANKEGLFKVKIQVNEENVFHFLQRFYIKGNTSSAEQIEKAYTDAYKRLLHPSLENEALQDMKQKADEEAINVFSTNLRQLLLSPPLGSRRVLAIDPGFRTGCKVVCLNERGDLLANTTIFPHPPQNELAKAKGKIAHWVEAYKIEAIAIGNGTASRETERMVKQTYFKNDLQVFVVSEDGASVYSASTVAREEFPNFDITVRGAVSIGRRLIDPLAELVKIDPKSIGVGQYQHEVNQRMLKESLDAVVSSCVNEVGVNINTASPYLLGYVSGLGSSLAENIIQYRQINGVFTSREQLKKVKGLGAKAFEQSAGFLRIPNATNPLDNSAVHPESYQFVEQIAKKLKCSVNDLIEDDGLINSINQEDFPQIDTFTFSDIIEELKKPGRDPRSKIKVLEFDAQIKTIEDLKLGQKFNGMVTNITNFGAFVNIGIKENGLIHKSNLAESYVDNPSDFIQLHEHVKVEVIQLDVPRKRIGLKRL